MNKKEAISALALSDDEHGTYTLVRNPGYVVIGEQCLCGYRAINSNREVRRTLRKQHRAKMAFEAIDRLEK